MRNWGDAEAATAAAAAITHLATTERFRLIQCFVLADDADAVIIIIDDSNTTTGNSLLSVISNNRLQRQGMVGHSNTAVTNTLVLFAASCYHNHNYFLSQVFKSICD